MTSGFRKPYTGAAGARWTPKLAPDDPEELPKYLFDELQALSDHIAQSTTLHLEMTYATPEREGVVNPNKGPEHPTKGDIIYADAEVVDVSEGLYYYNGVDWVLIA